MHTPWRKEREDYTIDGDNYPRSRHNQRDEFSCKHIHTYISFVPRLSLSLHHVTYFVPARSGVSCPIQHTLMKQNNSFGKPVSEFHGWMSVKD